MSSAHLRSRGAMFVHVPKTAGYSVTVALRGSDLDVAFHPVRNLRRPTGSARWITSVAGRRFWAENFTFCFVRNPWDWTVSGWKHVTRNKPCYDDPPEFGAFVRGEWRRGLGPNPSPEKYRSAAVCVAHHTQVTQWEHLQIGFPRRLAPFDRVCRFERLAEEWEEVCERLGVEMPLPHENRSERTHYSAYYDEETRRIVERRNAPLIERFGYRFDGG